MSEANEGQVGGKRIVLGVSIERHSRGTNWSIRVDGAESVLQVMSYAREMRKELEKQFGSVAVEG